VRGNSIKQAELQRFYRKGVRGNSIKQAEWQAFYRKGAENEDLAVSVNPNIA